jgi:hypothetical protein
MLSNNFGDRVVYQAIRSWFLIAERLFQSWVTDVDEVASGANLCPLSWVFSFLCSKMNPQLKDRRYKKAFNLSASSLTR